jgi:hypothetical protein
MQYTIPQLHAFGSDTKHGECVSGTQATVGSCTVGSMVGSGDFGQCATGSVASGGCDTGNSPLSSCGTGNSASYYCGVGNHVSGSHGV